MIGVGVTVYCLHYNTKRILRGKLNFGIGIRNRHCLVKAFRIYMYIYEVRVHSVRSSYIPKFESNEHSPETWRWIGYWKAIYIEGMSLRIFFFSFVPHFSEIRYQLWVYTVREVQWIILFLGYFLFILDQKLSEKINWMDSSRTYAVQFENDS